MRDYIKVQGEGKTRERTWTNPSASDVCPRDSIGLVLLENIIK